jgi:rubrerythrin
MGLFNRLGREVEKFKQSATAASEESEYVCRECGAEFATDYDACPECDSEHVEPVEG